MEAVVNHKFREHFKKNPITKEDAHRLIHLIDMNKAEPETIRAFVVAESGFDFDDLPYTKDWKRILSAADPTAIADMNGSMVTRCASGGLRSEEVALISVMLDMCVAEDRLLEAFMENGSFAEMVTSTILDAVLRLKPKAD